MIEWLWDPHIWASLITLTVMEIVLGIDNIIFISVVVSRLPKAQAVVARQLGLLMALAFRILFLFAITWIIGLKEPVFTIFEHDVSWRDLILIFGGLFLLAKATQEIHKGIEHEPGVSDSAIKAGFFSTILQIVVIDIIFSVDSIVTAIGMAKHVEIMIAAVVISMFVMYFASVAISQFIERHPTTKMLALSFLFLIGAVLIADGLRLENFHIPRGYIYFAMAFAAGVEMINIWTARRRKRKVEEGAAKVSGDQ